MASPHILDQMRADWNDRAREDARYYAAFGRRGQPDEEFFASAAKVVGPLELELRRLPRGTPQERRALEVGCGPGRLLRPMSLHFGEIHGVDISEEMIRLAQERFRGATGVHLHVTNGADLSPLADAYFDFVYSYAVFQHIPSREVVLAYFDEVRRVLKQGGVARLQLNGLPQASQAPDTWEGVRFRGEELADYARAHDLQLLALEGAGTQYLWTTWRKQAPGWCAGLRNTGAKARIERSEDAHTGEPVVPARGPFAYASFKMAGLSPDCDLNDLRATFDGAPGTPCYIGPEEWDGLHQFNVLLPQGVRTGMVPVELYWLGEPLCAPVWLRVIPPGPAVPRVCSLSDGTNLLAGTRIESGTVKVTLEDLTEVEAVSVAIDARPVTDFEWFETDARAGRFELNIRLPADLARGSHQIELRQGSRRFPPLAIELV